jgi:transcriptional regulator with XRE-family HTH domain
VQLSSTKRAQVTDNIGIRKQMIPDAEKVRRLRLERGWSQEQLAHVAGTTTRTVQRVESESSTSLETLKAIANACGLNFRELLFMPEPEPMIAQREELVAQLARHQHERANGQEIVARLAQYWNSKTPGVELNE